MGKMVISTNNGADGELFRRLMDNSTKRLNEIAKANPGQYVRAKSDDVEEFVCDTMKECAKGTAFEGTIELVSGHKFPDIVANLYYGTEVKSTKSDKWESFGNSIFENTRIKTVERIYLTFGRLNGPVEFRTKPYEQCISGVVVDHSPRYHIDMTIQEDGRETIFEELGIPYNAFRTLPDSQQVDLIAKKSREKLGKDETLWWHPTAPEQLTAPTIRLLSSLNSKEIDNIIAEAYCYFPEMLGNSSRKYNRYVLWLITDKNVATGSARDNFSAGGKVLFTLKNGLILKVPRTIQTLRNHVDLMVAVINGADERDLKDNGALGKFSKIG